MSIAVVPSTFLNTHAICTLPEGTSISGNGVIEPNEKANSLLFVINASESGCIQIVGGDSVLGDKDLIYTIPSEGTYLINLEVGPYLKTTGPNRGKIEVVAPLEFNVAVLQIR